MGEVTERPICNMALRSAVFAALRRHDVSEDCFAEVAAITHAALTTALAAQEAENAELRAKVEKLREALQDIAWPARLPSDGDPTVLRNHALATLAETQPERNPDNG